MLCSYGALQILRNQGRDRFRNRDPCAFIHHRRRPAIEQVPVRSLTGNIINARDAQLQPQFVECTVERGVRQCTAQQLPQLFFVHGAVLLQGDKDIGHQRSYIGTRMGLGRLLRRTAAGQRIEIREDFGGEQEVGMSKDIGFIRRLLA